MTGLKQNNILLYESYIKYSDDYSHRFKTYILRDYGYVDCIFQNKETIFFFLTNKIR